MTTKQQALGAWGEQIVARMCWCPRCKRQGTLKRLREGFKCADLLCDFCGCAAQVKTTTGKRATVLPGYILGAAWKPQEERLRAGVYLPLFIVVRESARVFAIHFVSSEIQSRSMYMPRQALSASARRPGWRGFTYDLKEVRKRGAVLIGGRGIEQADA